MKRIQELFRKLFKIDEEETLKLLHQEVEDEKEMKNYRRERQKAAPYQKE